MNKSVLYLECNSGISGDMTVAALLDLGADRKVLSEALASLPLSGYSIEIKDVFKSGIRACDFNVILDHDNHDHDMEYLHGKNEHVHTAEHVHTTGHTHLTEHTHATEHTLTTGHTHTTERIHTTEHIHTTGHGHEHTHTDGTTHSHAAYATDPHHSHAHTARNLHDITEIISAGNLTDNAKSLALRIFRILAEAEAFVHGKTIEEVHFHEVGAVDSIVDIAAVAVCLDNLQPDSVIVSPLTDGTGQIRCQHGLIPVPVPAVTAIASHQKLVLKISDIDGELVTPTGAAIAAALHSGEKLPTEFSIQKTGFGAGKRDYAATGILRAMLLEPIETDANSFVSDSADTILCLETNIDDCTGEALSFTMQKLLESGALDVFYTPVYMKKNRPAYLLRVLCRAEDRTVLESVIFKNTTTIGVRVQEMHRTRLPRQIISIETPWGMADVKCCTYNNETWYYPENDSISKLAETNQIGFSEMYHLVKSYAVEKL